MAQITGIDFPKLYAFWCVNIIIPANPGKKAPHILKKNYITTVTVMQE
jgi:hypothetical protein